MDAFLQHLLRKYKATGDPEIAQQYINAVLRVENISEPLKTPINAELAQKIQENEGCITGTVALQLSEIMDASNEDELRDLLAYGLVEYPDTWNNISYTVVGGNDHTVVFNVVMQGVTFDDVQEHLANVFQETLDTAADLINSYTYEELEAEPTLAVSQTSDLKEDRGDIRIWLSRMTVEDGADFDYAIEIEVYNPHSRSWEEFASYPSNPAEQGPITWHILD